MSTMPNILKALSLVALLIVPTLAANSTTSAYSFNANTFLMDGNFTYYNHPYQFGQPQARGYAFHINTTGDYPKTECPSKIAAKKQCPSPSPSDDATQFNTSLTQDGSNGVMHMNVAVPGGQQVYVANDGLLQYSKPGAALPKGSYAHLFSLKAHYSGSQYMISTPTFEFNSSIYWYSCAPPSGEGLNLTYAAVPGGKDVAGCLPFALISDAVYYQNTGECPEAPYVGDNGTVVYPYCGHAAYEYA